MKKFIIIIIVVYILALLNHVDSPLAPLADVLAFYVLMRYAGRTFSKIFYDERIQWPVSLAKIQKLYFCLLKLMNISFQVFNLFIILLLSYNCLYIQNFNFKDFKYTLLFLGMFCFMLISYLTFSECWCLHDRWAENYEQVCITKLLDEKIKAGKRPTCYDWLFFDFLFAFAIYCSIGKSAVNSSIEKIIFAYGIVMLWFVTIIFHGWIWYKYKDV